MTRRLTIIGVLAATLLAACGGSSSSNGASSAEGKKYVDAMVAQFDKEKASDSSSVPFSHDQAVCLSKKMIDAIGVDKLKQGGVTPTNIGSGSGLDNFGKKLTVAQASAVTDIFFDGSCFDMSKLLATQFKSSFTGQTPAAISCLAKELIKLSQFKQAMTNSILGKDSTNPFAGAGENALLPAFTKCKIDVSKLGG